MAPQKRIAKDVAALKAKGRATLKAPEAPDHLTEEQAEVWRASFSHLNPELITPEQFPIAEDYCRLVCIARVIAKQITAHEIILNAGKADADWLKGYNTLTRMQRENATAIHSCATKLCLTNKSTASSKSQQNAKKAKVKPHQFNPNQPAE